MVAETHLVVLGSAARSFARHGYRKTTIDDIAAGAGVAKGTIYLYCYDKQDLFTQSVAHEWRDWLEEVASRVERLHTAAERLMEMAIFHLEFLDQRPLVRDLYCGVLDAQVPPAMLRFGQLRDEGMRQVAAVLEFGIRRGEFAADLDAEATARVLLDMQLIGVALPVRSQLSKEDVDRTRIAAVRLVLEGLRRR